VALELEYVHRRSLAFDLWILVRTIPAVLSQRGAY
jgi:lipopolysaccharide/colanic/teichoic acid biosynthesis glycosyltransferase